MTVHQRVSARRPAARRGASAARRACLVELCYYNRPPPPPALDLMGSSLPLGIHSAASEGNLARGEDARNKRHNNRSCWPPRMDIWNGEVLLEAGADAKLTNNCRLTARELAARNCGGRKQDEAQIAVLLALAEGRQQQQQQPTWQQQEQQPQPPRPPQQLSHCPVCGASIPRRQKIDYLVDAGSSRHVTEFLASNALRSMRAHPQHHYHSILNMRSLQKEVSESWALVSSVRDVFKELNIDPSEAIVFDLCSGKGLTAACLALEFPTAQVVALDIISSRHLPHTSDLPNMRYVQADLFTSAEIIEVAMNGGTKIDRTSSASDNQLPPRRYGILVGSHLCGRLSTQAVKLFQSLQGVKCPCTYHCSDSGALL